MTTGLIYKKMNLVMKDIGSIGKDSTNTQQGFKFRGIDAFVNALYPALVKNGVFLTTEVLEKKDEIREVVRSNGKPGVDKHVALTMKYTFTAEDGSSVSSTMAGEGLDSGDKATGKALSFALKYALIQTFSVPTQDMIEGDLESPELGASSKASAATTSKTTTVVSETPVSSTEASGSPANNTSSPNPPNTTSEAAASTPPKTGGFKRPVKKAAAAPTPAAPKANGSAAVESWD